MKISTILFTALLGAPPPFVTAADDIKKQKGLLRGAQQQHSKDLNPGPIEFASEATFEEKASNILDRKLQSSQTTVVVKNHCEKDMWLYIWYEHQWGQNSGEWLHLAGNVGNIWGFPYVVNPVVHYFAYVSEEEHLGTISSQPISDYCVQGNGRYYCGTQWNFGSTDAEYANLDLTCPGNTEQSQPPTDPPTIAPAPTHSPAAAPVPISSGASGDRIDTNDKTSVVNAFNQRFKKPEPDMEWTGNVENCNAGTTSQQFQQRVIDQVNFYRGMVGLPSATLDTDNDGYQKHALWIKANQRWDHHPQLGTKCYTSEGADAANKSLNLYGQNGIAAIENYMQDPGPANTRVGHRRAILDPRSTRFATGDAPQGNALASFQGDIGGDAAQPEYIAWPSQGYFPYQLLPYYPGTNWVETGISGRWSFGLDYPADFSNAQVIMTNMNSGSKYQVIIERLNNNNYNDVDTIVFKPQGFPYNNPAQDTRIRVEVKNVSVTVNGQSTPRNYQYDVIVIDPDV